MKYRDQLRNKLYGLIDYKAKYPDKRVEEIVLWFDSIMEKMPMKDEPRKAPLISERNYTNFAVHQIFADIEFRKEELPDADFRDFCLFLRGKIDGYLEEAAALGAKQKEE